MENHTEVPTAQTLPDIPVRRLKLGADVAIMVRAVANPTAPAELKLDIRLLRRSAEALGGDEFIDTAAGFRVPVQQAADLGNAILQVARDSWEAWPRLRQRGTA
jgi:hypothetical protein